MEIDCVERGIYEIQNMENFPNGIRIVDIKFSEKAEKAFGIRRDLSNDQEIVEEALEG